MSTPGISEWVLIILAVLILFGGRKIPEFRGLGKGIREFNDAKNNVRRELEDGINETPSQSANNKAQSKATTTTQP
jgi:sec-independent protein translocase protein TatA